MIGDTHGETVAKGHTRCEDWPMRRGTALIASVAASIVALGMPVVPATTAATTSELKPPIVWERIPFGATRERQMAAYSKRHYGVTEVGCLPDGRSGSPSSSRAA